MLTKSQEKEGEHLITAYDDGHIVKEIDQTGKVTPDQSPEQIAEAEIEALIRAKIREWAITALISEGKLDKDGLRQIV